MGLFRKWPSLILAFINIFRPPRLCIQDRTNGSNAAFGGMAFTESTTNIAPSAPLNCSESRWLSFGWCLATWATVAHSRRLPAAAVWTRRWASLLWKDS